MWQDRALILLVIVQTCKSWTDFTPSVLRITSSRSSVRVFGCALHQDVQRLFEQAPAASSDQRGNEHTDERIRPFPAERHHKYGGGNRADRAEKVA